MKSSIEEDVVIDVGSLHAHLQELKDKRKRCGRYNSLEIDSIIECRPFQVYPKIANSIFKKASCYFPTVIIFLQVFAGRCYTELVVFDVHFPYSSYWIGETVE